jgi:hypothetical protein
MIPTVQFDPATLAIWTTTGTLSDEAAGPMAAVMAEAAHGGNPLSAVADLSRSDARRRRALWLASCVWHEKRHFFDVCLTNYGARRFRDLFLLAANVLPLVAEARDRGEPVWFPVEVYDCRVRRRLLGITNPPPNIAEVARRAREMKRFADSLDAPVDYASHPVHVGGQAQLEGLAQASQVNAIEHRFGVDEALAVTVERVLHLPREGPYRVIEAVAGTLGCTKTMASNYVGVNVGLASALFVTALSGRFFGVGARAPSDLVLPQERLARLIDELGPSPGRFDMPDEVAWELVDGAARRLWGRTALDEIKADIDAMDTAHSSMSQSWLTEEGLADAWADFVALRRRLLAAVWETGPASLSPRAFPVLWLDRLLPWHIVATPGGATQEDDSAPAVFARSFNQPRGLEQMVPRRVVWGRLHEAPAHCAAAGFAPRDRAAWLQILERHAPRARLMLNGRRHRLMVPPELERPIQEFAELGVEVRFDPFFEWSEDRDHATRAARPSRLLSGPAARLLSAT